MTEPRLALKFLETGAMGPYSKFSWPVPNGKPGAWVKAKGNLVACENGIHACTLEQSKARALRVQARDRFGNIFAWTVAKDPDVALALAQSWIEMHPDYTVEVVSVVE